MKSVAPFVPSTAATGEELMPRNLDVLSQVLQVLYEAPLNPSCWEEFLQLTARSIGAEAAMLLLYDSGDARSLLARQWEIGSNSIAPEEEQHVGFDTQIQAAVEIARRMETSDPVVAFAELERIEGFDDLQGRFRMPHGIFAVVERGASRIATLSVCRSATRGPFHEQDFELIRFLCPHIQRAYRLHLHFAGSRMQRASLQSALDSLSMGVILLASKGHVVTMNRAAERLLGDGNNLRVSREGLRAESAAESAQLDHLIMDATASSDAGLRSAAVLTVSRNDRPPLLLVVSAVRGFEVDKVHPVRAIVFVSDPAQRVRPTCDTLRALYGLTPAEYRLAMLLADGYEPATIAELVGVSRNTLKTQLASIYRKTDTSRQAQLVRLLLQLPATGPSIEA